MNNQLKDLTVLEPAGVLAGPLVGMFLAEYGATVIKIEPAGRGDVTRTWKLGNETGHSSLSSYYCCANWGKRSVALNLKTDDGRAVFYELTRASDIVLTSFKAGDASKLGIDYPTLKKYRRNLIYGSITGFGENHTRPAFDAVIQAESGFMHMNGTSQSGPLKMPVALMDVLAAHHLKEKLLLALLQREQTGLGDSVSVSLMEAALASLANQGSAWLVTGQDPRATGTEHPNIYPYGTVFYTGDHTPVLLAVGNDTHFRKLMEVLGKPKVSENSLFATNPGRSANREQLRPILTELIKKHENADQLMHELQTRGVPCGAILKVSEAIERHAQGGLLSGSHPDYGPIRGIPTSNTHSLSGLSSPEELGASTDVILQDYLNLKSSRLTELRKNRIIQ